MWREMREDGFPIISTWIDEDGDGDTEDFSELWDRIQNEIAQSAALLFYGDVTDAPWKGAFVEVGIALALGKPVHALIIGDLQDRTMRPIGSWLAHPLVRQWKTMGDAVAACNRAMRPLDR
jgi:nucleoside 2-deoxyribosyltransferase